MTIGELVVAIKKNGAAHELVCCVMQIDPKEALVASTANSLSTLEAY